MILLYADNNDAVSDRLKTILTDCGAKPVPAPKDGFFFLSCQEIPESLPQKGLAIITGNIAEKERTPLPHGWTGICEDENRNALYYFQKSGISVITCGMNPKSTVTLSSLREEGLLLSVQRSFSDLDGNTVEPSEYQIKVSQPIPTFIAAAVTAALLFHGIEPNQF